jgi:hypothetical protein
MSLFGVVELGSHTFRYLVAEYKDGVLVPILRGRSYVGLGKRLQRDGSFGLDAYDASIKAVEEFLNEINSLEPLRLWKGQGEIFGPSGKGHREQYFIAGGKGRGKAQPCGRKLFFP